MLSPSPAALPELPPLQIGPDSPSNTDKIDFDAVVHHPFDEEKEQHEEEEEEVLPWLLQSLATMRGALCRLLHLPGNPSTKRRVQQYSFKTCKQIQEASNFTGKASIC